MRGEKIRKILRYRGIRGIGQRKFAKARPAPRRHARRVREGKESVDEQFFDFRTLDLNRNAAANKLRTRARQKDAPRRRAVVILAQKRLLRFASLFEKKRAFAGTERRRTLFENLGFQILIERMVEIVAAEHKMVADGHAIELHASAARIFPFPFERVNERKVGRAAANVAHEYLLAGRDEIGPVLFMLRKPRIKRRLRLLDERHARQSGKLRRFEREHTRRFVERRGYRKNDVLRFQREIRAFRVPGGANVPNIERTYLHGRPAAARRIALVFRRRTDRPR